MQHYGDPPPTDETVARLARLEKRLDALIADLAAGLKPKDIAGRQAELTQLLTELDAAG